MRSIAFTLFLALAFTPTLLIADIYKYQDANGNWHFSDKKPRQGNSSQKVELLHSHSKTNKLEIELRRELLNGFTNFRINNPFIAPVQCFVEVPDGQKIKYLIDANSDREIASGLNLRTQVSDFEFWCVLGDPETTPDASLYAVPFGGYKSLEISQGFGGHFSHFEEPSIHAIDIAMPVGTPIIASRGGKVLSTNDDYAYAGVSSAFFFDKANYVQILHEDGTYALYGHLLIGKILVEPGEEVKTGQLIGYSGNTGYSTGPHLHFVIQYNNEGSVKSAPFKLRQSNGEVLTPRKGQWLLPYEDKQDRTSSQ